MSDAPSPGPDPIAPPAAVAPIPEAVIRPQPKWPMVIVWLVPIIAILFGAWVGIQALRERGPTITISFKSGEGIEVRKTRIKYKNVDIGEVRTVTLSEDRTRVIVTAQLSREEENLLVEDTRFWVVRPRISAGSVTGLGTLLVGSHIGMDAGRSAVPRDGTVIVVDVVRDLLEQLARARDPLFGEIVTRLSEHAMTMVRGRWPCAARRSNTARRSGQDSARKRL